MKPTQDDMRMVNALCAHAKLPPHSPDIERQSSKRSFSIKRDQYVGKGLASAVREFLEMRGTSDRGGLGAATVNEIYDALHAGGYTSDTEDEANAKRGLRIALTKNSQTFYRVSKRGDVTGAYGLLEWYPNAKPQDDDGIRKPKRGRPPKAKQKKRGRPPKSITSSGDSGPAGPTLQVVPTGAKEGPKAA